MCGIAGIYQNDPAAAADGIALSVMVETMRHRGPDEQRHVLRGRVGLGISRLAVIDPAGSHQPISNENDTVLMVFNGEIYNYRELRTSLEASGHRFSTIGDGEVIVHGYEQWGTGVFERLRGMFGIAIWDQGNDRLVLARDRLGIKPLYISRDGSRLMFASEVKALVAAGLPVRFRPETLDCYLAFRYVPAPDTVFEGVQKLRAGHFLVVDRGGERIERFHTLRLRPKSRISEEEAASQLFDLLQRSVRYRLQSDVPVGAFLSGGLDSGFLVALARELSPGRLDTFTIGFNRGGIYDETAAAAVVSRRFSTEQHSVLMNHIDFIARLPAGVRAMDEPMADPSSVPMMALSELAAQFVTVVLSGEGGDELFAGYPRYVGEAVAGRFPWPERAAGFLSRVLRRRLSRSLRRGIQGVAIRDRARRHLFWQEIITTDRRRRLLHATAPGELDPLRVIAEITGELDDGDDLDRLFYFDLRAWLAEDLLLKKDKMGMSASIEARVPYLDQDVVDFALRLPHSAKIRGPRGKRVLRTLLSKHMPPEILRRPKIGFAVPLGPWFRHELRDVVRTTLTEQQAFIREYLEPSAVSEMLRAHESGEDLSLPLYSLLVLELWGRIFVQGHPVDALSDRLRQAAL
jgi:asparagine synthase (glutamine-hydrolysing)